MTKRKIMVVSGILNADILYAWKGNSSVDLTFVPTDEGGIELATQQVFDAVVVDGRDRAINSKKLYALMPVLQPEAAVVPYGGEEIEKLQLRLNRVFRQKQAQRVKRILVLDSLINPPNTATFPFSAN